MTLKIDPNTYDALKLMEKPWQFLRNAGSHGVKGAAKAIGSLTLVASWNLAMLIASISLVVFNENWGGFLWVLMVLILGLLTTGFSAYRNYQYLAVQVFHMFYSEIRGILKKELYPRLVEQIESKSKLSLARSADQIFAKLPWLFRFIIRFIFKRIPIVNIVPAVREELGKGGKIEATRVMDEELDAFLVENMFQAAAFKWMFWLLPINILLDLFFIWKLI